ncbi:MAG: helix-turn-helix domain-containing protein [Bacteroidia bacterium]|jgi:AraC-like DNA-binding protein|nr:helix-turn-helix domain-containing protein [Bacteroidia bacterium]
MSTALSYNYKPVQPSVNAVSANVSYAEVLPDLLLNKFVYCYWQLKTRHKLSEDYLYRVAADGCTDVYFEAGNPCEIGVSGFSASSALFSVGREFQYFGIRFFPGAFAQLTGIPASEVAGHSVLLEQVHPQLYRRLVCATEQHESFAENADKALLDFLNSKSIRYDNRFGNALQLIFAHGGNMTIEEEIQTGISPRQLRRMFHHYIGASPKTFSKVVRFQNLLGNLNSLSALRRNTLYFDSGYFDQAHFIREFKTFYGLTPAQAAG